MKTLLALAFATAISAPAFGHDTVITKEKHTDAAKMMGQDRPAQDVKQVIWIGKAGTPTGGHTALPKRKTM